jgi:ubiquinone/menaquinone biosynthesis C-methylase UbiE
MKLSVLQRLIFFSCAFIGSVQSLQAYKDHEIWWEQSLDKEVSLDTFRNWLGGIHANSRVAVREYIRSMGYKSILDVPCGVCADYYGFQQDGIQITYQGMDITPKLVALHVANNIPVIEGSIEAIPFADRKYDVCYARHILEHLDGYEKALLELIRVASKEVIVVFFINPISNDPEINLASFNGNLLYHNRYDKQEIEEFIVEHPKVEKIEWIDMGSESILHIYLKK